MEDIIYEDDHHIIHTVNWPNSRFKPLVKKSPKDSRYNCAAYAIYEEKFWYEYIADEDIRKGFCLALNTPIIWPAGILQNHSIDAYIDLYKSKGFEKINDLNISIEENYIKIAIYGSNTYEFTHVSRQLTNGKWVSKLGPMQDIEHDDLDALEGPHYGTVKVIMKKKI